MNFAQASDLADLLNFLNVEPSKVFYEQNGRNVVRTAQDTTNEDLYTRLATHEPGEDEWAVHYGTFGIGQWARVRWMCTRTN
jgi:hypothetical protein